MMTVMLGMHQASMMTVMLGMQQASMMTDRPL